MLIAQALGEYAMLGVLITRFHEASLAFEDLVGSWGTEGMVALVVAVIVWRIVLRVK